jgi:hypothetical protein
MNIKTRKWFFEDFNSLFSEFLELFVRASVLFLLKCFYYVRKPFQKNLKKVLTKAYLYIILSLQ